MKKHVFKGVAAVAVLALLVLNVSVVRNGKRTMHFKLNSGETVLADEWSSSSSSSSSSSTGSGSGSGSGSGDMLLGTPTAVYGWTDNTQTVRLSVVAYFDNVKMQVGTKSSADIAAEIKAKNPSISGTDLQAQVTAAMSSISQSNATVSGVIEKNAVLIEGTDCPGFAGICFRESVMDAQLRVIDRLRGTSGN